MSFFTPNRPIKRIKSDSPFAHMPSYQRKVCTQLMKCTNVIKPKELKDGNFKEIKYIKLECPHPNCTKKGSGIFIEEGKGYTNAFKHFSSCYGGDTELYRLYMEAEQLSEQGSEPTGSFFNVASMTEQQQDLFRWADLILEENLPLSTIEKKSFRSFGKVKHNFGVKRMKDTLSALSDIVKGKIADELKDTKHGAIMHDGWTMSGVHYIGLFACYIIKRKFRDNGTSNSEDVPVVTLLSCAPMGKIDATDEEDTDTAPIGIDSHEERSSKFTAEVHAAHFKQIFFECYGISLTDWAKAAVADNTTTNRKTCRILGLPHVGCNNHKLNLDMESWVTADNELKETLEKIASTMKSAKNSLKNAAILSELTNLKPVLYNKTRWSGKFDTIDRFIRIRSDLITAANNIECDVEVEDGMNFLRTCEKYHRIMKRMNEITIKMQTSYISLSSCRRNMEYIISRHETDTDKAGKPFYLSAFAPNRIRVDGPLSPNSAFESGVVKIQEGRDFDLTDVEKVAVRGLLLVENEVDDEVIVEEEGGADSDDDSFNALDRDDHTGGARNEINAAYINVRFIYGSCAEVERLWSIAKHILTDSRKGMMDAEVFETIIFLKLNKRLWTINDFVEADSVRKNKK